MRSPQASSLRNTETTKSRWILGPLADLILMYGMLMLSAIMYFYLPSAEDTFKRVAVIVVTLLLSGGHLLAPLVLLLFSSNERNRAAVIDPRIGRKLVLIAVFCVTMFSLSSFLFFVLDGSEWRNELSYIPLALIGATWVFWNGWHFGMQHFGILQIYRIKSDTLRKFSRQFDYWSAIIVGYIFPLVMLFSAGRHSSFFRHYLDPLQFIDPIVKPLTVLVVVLGITTCALLFLTKSFRTPLVLAYTSLYVQAYLVWVEPGVFYVLSVAGTHWFQEIFLISWLYSRDKTNQERAEKSLRTRKTFYLISAMAFLFTLSILKSRLHSIPFIYNIRISGDSFIYNLGNQPALLYFAGALIASFFMFFNLAHFYLDRIIYQKRAWKT
ncbi:MAG: hypothetical protein RBT63_05030 [Bdellovibrionales bacterium]|jgi:hypothetical protein|nr:hypothetical protein [Bdellovibrionales bacterium]